MTFRTSFFAAIVFTGALLACGSGGSGGGVPQSGGGAGDSASFLSEFCTAVSSCCGRVGRSADVPKCTSTFQQATASLAYDAAKGQSCLASVRARQNSPSFCDDITPGADCKGVFHEKGSGTKAPGETCEKDGDCASSPEGAVECAFAYTSDGKGGSTKRFCQINVAGGRDGDGPCLATRDGTTTSIESSSSSSSGNGATDAPPTRGYVCDVADGVYCDQGRACKRIGNVGDACEGYSSYACGKAGYCDSASRKCLARVGPGGDCKSSSSSCQEGTRCDYAAGKCKELAVEGAPCTSSSDCASSYCKDQKCVGSGGGGDDESLALVCGG